MQQPEPPADTLPADTLDDSPARPPSRPRRRWLGWALGLAMVPVSLGALAVLAVLWGGARLYDQPFAWYNLNRIDAAADRAARAASRPGAAALPPTLVVALGGTALRDATLDEREMTALAAERGVPHLQFLRIVHRQAQFADFEPLLDRLVAAKPSLILLDRELLTAERGMGEDLVRYARGLLRLYDGTPYLQDQVALQYGRGCAATPAAWLTGGTSATAPESGAAAERVRGFIDRAWAAGIRVALIEVRGPDAATAGAGTESNLPLWHYATRSGDGERAGEPSAPCAGDRDAAIQAAAGQAAARQAAAQGAPLPGHSGRAAFSRWLTGGIASVVAPEPERQPARAVAVAATEPAATDAIVGPAAGPVPPTRKPGIKPVQVTVQVVESASLP